MLKDMAMASVIVGIATMGVLGGMGMASAQGATPTHQTPAQCTTSVKQEMGRQVSRKVKSTMVLPSNAAALVTYQNCNQLQPQTLNVVVGSNSTIKADGAKIYTHWHK